MNYLSETFTSLDATDLNSIRQMLFEFNVTEKDYFLKHKTGWDILNAGVYNLKINGSTFKIPSGHFVMIGDEEGSTDWIRIDELINRDIPVITLNNTLTLWDYGVPQLKDYHEGCKMYWPRTAHIIPVTDGNRVVLVSDRDQHPATKFFHVSEYLDTN